MSIKDQRKRFYIRFLLISLAVSTFCKFEIINVQPNLNKLRHLMSEINEVDNDIFKVGKIFAKHFRHSCAFSSNMMIK